MSFIDLASLVVAAFAALVAAYAVFFVGPSSWDYLHRRGAMPYRVISPDYVDGRPYVAPTALAIAPHAALLRRHAARIATEAATLAAALDEARAVVAQQWSDATIEIERLADCHARATASRHRTRAASYARRAIDADAARWEGTTPCYLSA